MKLHPEVHPTKLSYSPSMILGPVFCATLSACGVVDPNSTSSTSLEEMSASAKSRGQSAAVAAQIASTQLTASPIAAGTTTAALSESPIVLAQATPASTSYVAPDAVSAIVITPSASTTSSGTTSSTGGAPDTKSVSTPPPVSPTGRTLLNPDDIKLIGRFMVPAGGSGLASTSYTIGAMTIGSSGAQPSLYITGMRGADIAYGGNPNVHVGEINVPASISLSSNLTDLPTATFKQPMTDVLEGHIGDVFDPALPTASKLEVQIRGLYKHGNDLLVNAIMFYDNNSVSIAGHFSRPADLSLKGAVKGPVRVAPQVGVRHTPGPMFAVPPDLQTRYNLPPVATGVNGLSINSSLSNGPGVVLFDPAGIKTAPVRSSIPGTVLADYPYPGKTFAETMGFRFSMADSNPLNQNPWWTPLNHTRGGGAWLAAQETVVFAGFRGMGAPYYGPGNAPPSWGVTDPLSSNSTPHAYPYDHTLFLFDQNEYIAVAQGTKNPNDVKAYAVKSLPDPFAPASTVYQICGSAHDLTAKRLYVMKCWPDYSNGRPMIEVYQLPN